MKMHFLKTKPQVAIIGNIRAVIGTQVAVIGNICKGFHNQTFLDSLTYELDIHGVFLKEKELDAFSTICTEVFNKHAPKQSDIYDLSISLPLHLFFINNQKLKQSP